MLLLDGTYEAYSVYRSWISREVLGNIFRVLVQHGRSVHSYGSMYVNYAPLCMIRDKPNMAYYRYDRLN